jgi:hypothetical protein
LGFDLPALLSAIATACFRGIDGFALSSVFMFALIVFWLEPFLSGISDAPVVTDLT